MSKSYERTPENYEEIPLLARRSGKEVGILEFLRLREEVEDHYKQIRDKKRRIQELLDTDPSIKDLDTRLRKIPRAEDDRRKEREEKGKAKELSELEEEGEKKERKKKKNALEKKKQTHKSYIKQGYTMSEEEIAKEGGEVEKQYVYFKDLGEGKSSTHRMRGMEGLQLSSLIGSPSPMQQD